MINKLEVQNFTLFSENILTFNTALNVIMGENSSGKTHILKLLYSILISAEQFNFLKYSEKERLEKLLIDNLKGVFQIDDIRKLITIGQTECQIALTFENGGYISLSISSIKDAGSSLLVDDFRNIAALSGGVFIPTKEIVSFVAEGARYDSLEKAGLDKTYSDLALKLRQLPSKKIKLINEMPLLLREDVGILQLSGKIPQVDIHGDLFPVSMTSDGLKKILQLATLVRNGQIRSGQCVLWDEPEANLNPKNLRLLMEAFVTLSVAGIQIIFTTHSLYVIRHIEYIAGAGDSSFLNFTRVDGVSKVDQGLSLEEIGDVASLEEEERQIEHIMVGENA